MAYDAPVVSHPFDMGAARETLRLLQDGADLEFAHPDLDLVIALVKRARVK